MAGRGVRFIPLLLALAALLSCDGRLRQMIELFARITSEGIIYVDGTSGSDENPGSREAPKKSIRDAVELALALGAPRSVHVAEGTYVVEEAIELHEGISVYGGFAAGSWLRDLGGRPTIVEAIGIEAAVLPDAGVTGDTLLDGLTIRAAAIDVSACILCRNSSPTIQNCILETGSAGEDAIGIYTKSSSPRIWNNVIYGEDASGLYTGILCSEGSSAIIQSNTVWTGDKAGDAGICVSSSHCTIDNNILFSSGPGCGIYILGSSALPQRAWNNDFWCSLGHACIHDGTSYDFLGMLGYFDVKSVDHRNNGSIAPDFMDEAAHDYRLGSESPIDGCDLSAFFTTDRDGNPRTVPWSVGAYEKD
jgi:hypothetical protein